jgi:hypothetical protein
VLASIHARSANGYSAFNFVYATEAAMPFITLPIRWFAILNVGMRDTQMLALIAVATRHPSIGRSDIADFVLRHSLFDPTAAVGFTCFSRARRQRLSRPRRHFFMKLFLNLSGHSRASGFAVHHREKLTIRPVRFAFVQK